MSKPIKLRKNDDARPLVSVVIVSYDTREETLACLASLEAQSTGFRLEVIVVDNGTGAVVGDDVELIRSASNLGFGGGANVGFRRAAELGATAVALLNDDVEVEPGWLQPLLAALDADPRLGAVQPKLLLAGTNPVLVNSVGVLIGGDGAGTDIGYREPDGPQFAEDRQIESFTGGAVLFRSAFLEATGGFDDTYFLYYEDVDLLLRLRSLGGHWAIVPDAAVVHDRGSSTADRRVPDIRPQRAELLARCQTDPAALAIPEVERRMLEYLAATCEVPSDLGGNGREKAAPQSQNPLLAGNSVHKDYSVLERWMPDFIGRLSYRLIDVSCLKELRRRWYPGVPAFDKETMARDWLPDLVLDGAEHDALYDVKCSLAEPGGFPGPRPSPKRKSGAIPPLVSWRSGSFPRSRPIAGLGWPSFGLSKPRKSVSRSSGPSTR